MPQRFDGCGMCYEAAVQEAIAFAGQPHRVYVEAKVRRLLELARRRLGEGPLDVLDVGCGIGLIDRELVQYVGSLHGVDVSEAMVERARETVPGVDYRVYDGARLPYEDGQFDLAFAICVLHHVAAPEQLPLLQEMRRVVRPGGLVIAFEHNPWNPLTRKVVRSCAFDVDVELLPRGKLAAAFRAADIEVTDTDYLLFSPWRSPLVETVERRLRRLPLGAQYVVAGVT